MSVLKDMTKGLRNSAVLLIISVLVEMISIPILSSPFSETPNVCMLSIPPVSAYGSSEFLLFFYPFDHSECFLLNYHTFYYLSLTSLILYLSSLI